MTYNEFKAAILKEIKNYLPFKYSSYALEMHTVTKNNKLLDGICFNNNSEKTFISPIIYANDLYDKYKTTGDISKTAREGMDTLISALEKSCSIDLTDIENNIVITLMNYRNNEKLLENIFHTKYYDMAIAFKWVVNMDDIGFSSTYITNDMAKEFGFDHDRLYLKARENTKRLLPAKVEKVNDYVKGLFLTPSGEKLNDIYVMTNIYRTEGAAHLMDVDLLQEIKNMMNSDYYIIPTSVHELLLIKESTVSAEKLKEGMRELSSTILSKEDYLSGNLYLFNNFINVV